MIRINLILFVTLISSCLFAQQKEGKIVFQEEIKFEINESRLEQMTEEQRNRMKKRMKRWGRKKKTLVFNSEASVYRNYKAELDANSDEDFNEATDNGWSWKSIAPSSSLYIPSSGETKVQLKEFMEKKFLIIDNHTKPIWKLTGKQERVLNFNCQEATYQKDDSTKYTVLFTTQIPSSVGPIGLTGLPGAILKVTENEGSLTLTAISVNQDNITEKLEKPTKGKKVTEEKYYEIVKAKMLEMKENKSGGSHWH